MGPSSELLRSSIHCLKTISLSKRIYFLYPKLSDNNLKFTSLKIRKVVHPLTHEIIIKNNGEGFS